MKFCSNVIVYTSVTLLNHTSTQTRYYTRMNTMSLDYISESAVFRMVLLHIVGWKKPHLKPKEVNMRHWRSAFWKRDSGEIPHPSIHLSFPPPTVTFFGDDLDCVSFSQRQLQAVSGWKVIPGPCCPKTLHSGPFQKTSALHLGWMTGPTFKYLRLFDWCY